MESTQVACKAEDFRQRGKIVNVMMICQALTHKNYCVNVLYNSKAE